MPVAAKRWFRGSPELKARAHVNRLAVREYGPLIAVVLTWLVVTAVVGPADAVRVLAAVTLARAARALTAPAPLVPLRMRLGSSRYGRSLRTALAIEAIALAGALLLITAIVLLFTATGQDKMAWLCAIAGLAIPGRSLTPLAAGRALGKVYRLTLTTVALALVAAGWLAGAGLLTIAALLSARDWLALPIAAAIAPPVAPAIQPAAKLRWREIANYSHALARRRAVYRFSKSFLQAFLGPFGGFAARTGRGMRVDRKLARFVPKHPAALGGLAAVAAAIAVAIIVGLPEPLLLVVAASLLRSSAAAANVLLWGQLADGSAADTEIDDDDD